MRPMRPIDTARRGRSARRTSPVFAAAALAAVLTFTATACGPEEDGAKTPSDAASQASDGKVTIPDDLKDRLKEHGIDLDKWRDGEWKNWDKDKWLREAKDYVNPIIEDLWDPDRMRDADKAPENPVDSDISGDDGVTDPTPPRSRPPACRRRTTTTPRSPASCSSTVPRDRWSVPRPW